MVTWDRLSFICCFSFYSLVYGMVFKHPFYSLSGVVSSEHYLASLIGSRVLVRGGNGVDAAVATSLVLTVTLPHLGGIGGDFFALVRDPNGKVFFVDGSGYAPYRLTRELVVKKGYSSMPVNGPLSINVPGLVDGLRVMWEKWGSTEWRKLVEYARSIADKGFGVSHSFSYALKNLYEELVQDPGSKETYYYKGIPKPGEVFKYKGLATALEHIADDPRSFYEGIIAEKIAEYVQNRGGVLEYDDLKEYRAKLGEPIRTTYRGRTIYEMPPSTQGITTLHLLKLLEDYDLRSIEPNSIERVKLFLKAAKIAYAARDKYVTDPRYMSVSIDYLLSQEFIESLKEQMQKDNPLEKVNSVKDGDTTFFAVADKEGWLIAGIQSLFYPFGSHLTEPTFNITLNCRASSFSLDENHVNRLEPRKKTLHTLSAIILEDNDRTLAIGLSGGHFRPLLHAEIFTNVIDYGMDPQEALEYPRFIWHLWTNKVDYEEGYNIRNNGEYKFNRKPYPSRLGVAAIVELKDTIRAGYSDIRGDGMPIGTP